MSFKHVFVTSLLINATLALAEPALVLDKNNEETLPANFRTTKMALPKGINTAGLKSLNLIGSGQFSHDQLNEVMHAVKPNSILIADLRQESHGYLNCAAVSWRGIDNLANKDLNPNQIEKDQFSRLKQLDQERNATVFQIGLSGLKTHDLNSLQPVSFPVQNVYAESDLAKEFYARYTRFYIPDNIAPDTKQVDRFIKTIQNVPKNTWIYVHDLDGGGRMVTFMAICDMMHNAKKVKFDDILKRQELLGASQKQPDHEQIKLLKDFYKYAQNNKDNFKTSYTMWKNEQTMLAANEVDNK